MQNAVYKRYGLMPKRQMSFECVVPKNFGTLPVPVLVRIFRHLDSYELLRNVSLVCRHWRYAVMQPQLIKSFRVYGGVTSLPYIYNHLRKFRTLKSLHIQDVTDPMDILLQASKFVTDLRKLYLINCGDLDFNVLTYVIQMFPNLDTLDLEQTNFEGFTNYPSISNLNDLKSLNLSKTKNLTMQDILETILNCRKLEELNIGLLPPLVDLRDADACLIIGNLSQNLKSLTIDARSLTSRTYEKIFECKHLRKLCINYGVNLSSDFLTNLWRQLPRLEELGLSNNRVVTGGHVKNLFSRETAGVPENIISIDLTQCVLMDDDALDAIANCCRRLKEIHLKSCKRITRIDLICKNCKGLRLLNVAFCDGIKPTFHAPKKLDVLVIHEDGELLTFLLKFKHRKHLKVFIALSEYTDYLKRLKKFY